MSATHRDAPLNGLPGGDPAKAMSPRGTEAVLTAGTNLRSVVGITVPQAGPMDIDEKITLSRVQAGLVVSLAEFAELTRSFGRGIGEGCVSITMAGEEIR